MGKSIVSVRNLSHRYSVQWAVKDVSFEINEKGVTGLLGSNGAGKSTTMNIICGVLNQTEGDVFINGVNLRENPVEAKKNIFRFQQPGDLLVIGLGAPPAPDMLLVCAAEGEPVLTRDTTGDCVGFVAAVWRSMLPAQKIFSEPLDKAEGT